MAKRKHKSGRLKTAADALQQLQEIQDAQDAFRRAGTPHKINSTKKSKDRFKNANRNLRTAEDFFDEYR